MSFQVGEYLFLLVLGKELKSTLGVSNFVFLVHSRYQELDDEMQPVHQEIPIPLPLNLLLILQMFSTPELDVSVPGRVVGNSI